MPERILRSPNPHRASSRGRIQQPKPKIRWRKPRNTLTRSLSEPCLRNKIQFLPSSSSSSSSRFTNDDDVEFNEQAALLRPHTSTDGGLFSSAPILPFASTLIPPNFKGLLETKVVVSVTVERSPGPVRAMVKLGATINEAIGVVIDKYNREGRSPKLDQANSFQLHHSHFSLQSLNKSDTIGEVGSRNFYLRRRGEGRDPISDSGVEVLKEKRPQTVPSPSPTHIFFSFIARRLRQIKRRAKRLWRVVDCISCG